MGVPPISVRGELVEIRPYRPEDVDELLRVRLSNRAFLEPLEPARPESFYTRDGQHAFVEAATRDWEADRNYNFGIFLLDNGSLAGHVSLANVARGAWQNATIGYYVDQPSNNQGIGTEAVLLATSFAFEHADLHRVQAGVMPRNKASARVLQKAGYRYEGRSLRYLKINGVWEDHEMFAITREEWPLDQRRSDVPM
jgi:ribosomal-protein-alanine N-acetyltransferase